MNIEEDILLFCTETSGIVVDRVTVVPKYLSLAFMVTLPTFNGWTLRYFVYLETFQASATE